MRGKQEYLISLYQKDDLYSFLRKKRVGFMVKRFGTGEVIGWQLFRGRLLLLFFSKER